MMATMSAEYQRKYRERKKLAQAFAKDSESPFESLSDMKEAPERTLWKDLSRRLTELREATDSLNLRIGNLEFAVSNVEALLEKMDNGLVERMTRVNRGVNSILLSMGEPGEEGPTEIKHG